ncbi:MAG: ribonuclease H family protein [Muribaculaceae bacterium]|nr:ribonuclease H family protein [Muribaculaceae bacterium]
MNYNKRYYVVWKGRQPGVYDSLEDAMEQVDDYPGALFKSYGSPAEAAEAYRKGERRSDREQLSGLMVGAGEHRLPKAGEPDYFQFPEIDLNGWAVDASCLGNPGKMEYRGVELISGRELFRVGPFEKSTNNIGEFLAIVHALALQKKLGEQHTIYSDSRTGMAWVRNRKVKTNLTRDSRNEPCFCMMERALAWLNSNPATGYPKILKWETDRWGEVPADFGRKG